MFIPGDDVWVDFDGDECPGVVEKVESSGYLRCLIQTDPLCDYGKASARIMPLQTVAVRASHVRARTEEGPPAGEKL